MTFLGQWGVRKSRTSPYNPRCNGQCEQYNGILWRTVECILTDRNLPMSAWNKILPEALASIRTLHWLKILLLMLCSFSLSALN